MAKNRQEKIDKLTAQITEQQNQLKLEKKKQSEEARKAKTRRQVTRHGLFENMLPETISLTDGQYKTFLEKAVANDYGRRILASIIAHGEKSVDEKQGNSNQHEEVSTS